MTRPAWRRAKRLGFADGSSPTSGASTEDDGARRPRGRAGVVPTYKTVDTCAAEFAAETPYHYSTYEDESEVRPRATGRKVVILGSGPNRIGQGIEFDYCCVHASFALREAGYETIMVNCNPETVSTDYDTSDRLYFEPLTQRGRAQRHRRRAAVQGDRVARRADAAQARPARSPSSWWPARRPSRSTTPRIARSGTSSATSSTSRSPRAVRRSTSSRRCRSPTRSGSRCWCGRATCSVGGRCRSSTTATTSPGRWTN